MKLTVQQEHLIARYEKELEGQLEKRLPADERRRAISRFRRDLEERLAESGKETVEDVDVLSLLKQQGTPVEAAISLIRRHSEEKPAIRLSREDNRIWLGVCASLADRFDIPPLTCRIATVVLGLITGPLAIMLYLAIYLVLYFTDERPREERIHYFRVGGRIIATFLIALALHHGTRYAILLIGRAHELILKRPVPGLGEWGWIQWEQSGLAFWAIVICVPLAALSAMPLANAWDYSIKRLSQALLALYGVVLSFGLASMLTGIILEFVKEFTGGNIALPF